MSRMGRVATIEFSPAFQGRAEPMKNYLVA